MKSTFHQGIAALVSYNVEIEGFRLGFWSEGARRREMIYTIAWDALVVAIAILARWGLLLLRSAGPEALAADWGIRLLGWVADWVIVGLAFIFAVFDLLKRVVTEVKEFRAVLAAPYNRGEAP